MSRWLGGVRKKRAHRADRRAPSLRRSLLFELLEDRRPLAADAFEPNDTLATATVLGSPQFVTVSALTIHDASDVDFFRVTANQTGKLVVRSLFEHAAGDLRLDVLDSDGTVIASSNASSAQINQELVTLPVVSQQLYVVRVQGAVSGALNDYDLEIQNVAAPIPTGVFLHPADDTGASNSDNVTANRTPRFFIDADLLNFAGVTIDPPAGGAGADVEVQLVGSNTGAVVTLNATRVNQSLWSATVTSALAPDRYFVQAATRIRDGATPAATGRTQLSAPLWLTILADEQGPQISGVSVMGYPAYNLFGGTPAQHTPLVTGLTITVTDGPNRTLPGFANLALDPASAINPAAYSLVGDRVGAIAVLPAPVEIGSAVDGQPATARISLQLVHLQSLPDDRYTLTIRDSLRDPAGNALDGEAFAFPGGMVFPTGNGAPGGDFVVRFTVDSRPEIGSHVAQSINVDANGNFVWDVANSQIGGDVTNADVSWTLPVKNADGTTGLGGFNVHDVLLAGKFRGSAAPVIPGSRYFDQLAAFGSSAELGGAFRWIIDTDSDGVVTLGTDIRTFQPLLPNFNVAGAIPIAGNFNGNRDDGDEIGLYNAGKWGLDVNRNFIIEAHEIVATNLLGLPIVGDFDGDGSDDLAVFNNNQFFFDLRANGFGGADQTLVWGFPGVLDRPVAADMDQDGIDDIGLWVPRANGAEWYVLASNDLGRTKRAPGTIATLNHAFSPAPFGHDIYAEFGNERALPILGNFDPPGFGGETMPAGFIPGDFDGTGQVDGNDFLRWQTSLGSTVASRGAGADGNADRTVDRIDLAVWKSVFNTAAAVDQALVQNLAENSAENVRLDDPPTAPAQFTHDPSALAAVQPAKPGSRARYRPAALATPMRAPASPPPTAAVERSTALAVGGLISGSADSPSDVRAIDEMFVDWEGVAGRGM